MLTELIATAHRQELLAKTRRIETMAAYEQLSGLERLAKSVRVARARLGLLPVEAS